MDKNNDKEIPESHWNYRIIRHADKDHEGNDVEWYNIHEVFYEKGKPIMVTHDPIDPFGETVDELGKCLNTMRTDFDRCKDKIINYDDFSPGGKYYSKDSDIEAEIEEIRAKNNNKEDQDGKEKGKE